MVLLTEYRRCQPPCACFITIDDPHSKCVKCMGFSHAREAVFGLLKCKFCENLCLKTLRSKLEVFERYSSVFPRRAPEAKVEPEVMESEQTDLALSLPLSPEHLRASSPVEFAHDYLYPSRLWFHQFSLPGRWCGSKDLCFNRRLYQFNNWGCWDCTPFQSSLNEETVLEVDCSLHGVEIVSFSQLTA